MWDTFSSSSSPFFRRCYENNGYDQNEANLSLGNTRCQDNFLSGAIWVGELLGCILEATGQDGKKDAQDGKKECPAQKVSGEINTGAHDQGAGKAPNFSDAEEHSSGGTHVAAPHLRDVHQKRCKKRDEGRDDNTEKDECGELKTAGRRGDERKGDQSRNGAGT
jgi:hypothetical protein